MKADMKITTTTTRTITLVMTEDEAEQLGSLCMRDIIIPQALISSGYDQEKVTTLLETIRESLGDAGVELNSSNLY